MRKWLTRLRGAVGMGLTWAVAWLGVGAIVSVVTLVNATGTVGLGFALLVLAYNSLRVAAAGFVVGGVFSVVLGIADGRRRFDQMALPRVAGWGAAGGAIVGALQLTVDVFPGFGFPMSELLLVLYGLLGAGCAAGSLALARRADDQELLESGQHVAEIGLTSQERRALFGNDRPR